MHTPKLLMHPLPRDRVALTVVTGTSAALTSAALTTEQVRTLAAHLARPRNHWCEDAWLIRRSPDGRRVMLTFYRQVWGIDRTALVELSDDDARSLAADLVRGLSPDAPAIGQPLFANPWASLRRFMSLHRI